ncbi:lasso peptide biosynthesis B2 protein [Maribellus mangrovi]|uniref:lasso peptide biosynthesis B2 protein n=1 Tax=Maribellus mangrovi TaxID=3133146 RepID=UPI0030EB5484
MKQIKKWQSLPKWDKKLLLEALVMMYLAKVVLLMLPFKWIMRISTRHCSDTTPDIELLISIKSAIARANRFSFWKNVCLVQSLTARWMLNRRNIPSRLSLGIKHNKNGKPEAHAWLKVSQFEIIDKNWDYLELKNF